jgi:hypothetical protein
MKTDQGEEMPTIFRIALVMSLLVITATAAGVEQPPYVCALPLGKSLDLLDGRLTLRVPAPAKVQQRQKSFMAAPESLQEETRVVIESGDSHLSFTVWELFATAPADLEKAVRQELQRDPLTIQSRSVPSGLRLVEFFPNAPQANANLIWGAYVANSDGTLQRIAFYGDGPQAKLPPSCLSTVKAMAESLALGKRALNLKGGATTVGGQLTVNLPPSYTTSIQNGIDFTVYKLKKVVPLGNPSGSIGLYLGGHPSFNGQGQTGGKATLLGKPAEWLDQSNANYSQALIKLDPESHQYAHVFIKANSASELKELKQVAGSFALK